ncbi:cell division control protein Cdc6 [Suhomyces tanzawaensis NRRL Y-17324]|uniref:Cell division control protein n=1 Tax=Suhomyces tanzawaensis NRRL Y-17324 TaxID=984487 RepID=A0A1E4SFL0_9ASCO|nr:cell division control protein Cdc6 [Suhomyces tanzawaensis NRRL Y-17324]ODV78266.1 cell division control protein Cdc6 [Suhomyces tanzawaensis NRRL Y-17324]
MRDISNIAPSTPKKQKLHSTLITPTKQITSGLLSPASTPTKTSITDSNKGVARLFTAPSTPTKSTSKPSIYTQAKALFQRGSADYTSPLVSREVEALCLNRFLLDNITNHTSNSLYISGPPGTGKTAQINVSFKALSSGQNIKINGATAKVIQINCMTLNAPEHIFHEIYSQVVGTLSISYRKRKTFDDLVQLLNNKELELNSVVVVLDEMDCLITRDQQILFELFRIATPTSDTNTKLVLIGISNALDLTDKFLPRLKRNGLNPQALQFLPYTFEQIKAVIIGKLRSLIPDEDKENCADDIPIFHPSAIQLCCKKSASITGDLRKAFDMVYKSIEVVEENTKKKNKDISSLTWLDCPKVLIPHVAKICSSSFGQKSLSSLNLLQKAVLCCLFTHQGQDINVNTLYDFYIKQPDIEKLLGNLKKGEFLEIISALESTSVVTLGEKKLLKCNVFNVDIGNKIIRPNVPFDDVIKSIGDVGILKRIVGK